MDKKDWYKMTNYPDKSGVYEVDRYKKYREPWEKNSRFYRYFSVTRGWLSPSTNKETAAKRRYITVGRGGLGLWDPMVDRGWR